MHKMGVPSKLATDIFIYGYQKYFFKQKGYSILRKGGQIHEVYNIKENV